MSKKDCNCKKKKTKQPVIENTLYRKDDLENAVQLLDVKRRFDTEEMKMLFDLYNAIYSKNEINYTCGDCQKRVSRGLRYKLDELNGKRKTKR